MLKIPQVTRIKTRLAARLRRLTLLVAAAALFSAPADAGDAAITEVEIKPVDDNVFRISVTLQHEDTGWDHYANRWDVLDEAGKVLGSRVLAHPHVNEQPFTRSLTLSIPPSVAVVTIVASDSVHGDNEETVQAKVPRE